MRRSWLVAVLLVMALWYADLVPAYAFTCGLTEQWSTPTVARIEHGLVAAHTSVSRAPTTAHSGGSVVMVRATGYCSCAICCGKSDGITASGTRVHWGTIAAPRGWAFGTKYRISGLSGVFTVEDRGGSIRGDRIDIWFPSHAEALKWGVRTVTLTRVE